MEKIFLVLWLLGMCMAAGFFGSAILLLYYITINPWLLTGGAIGVTALTISVYKI